MKVMTVANIYPDLDVLAAVIAHSQIVVAQRAEPARHLPAGYDEVDIAILEWIAAEARRAPRAGGGRRRLTRM